MFSQWLNKHNLSTPKEIFLYTAWWNHQAEDRHKKNLKVVVPNQIKISKKAITSEVIDFVNNDKIKELESIFGERVLIRELVSTKKIADYLLRDEERKKGVFLGFEGKITNLEYSGLSVDFSFLDGYKFGEYEIRLPKNSTEVIIGGLFLNNCMGSAGASLCKELMTDPKKYEQNFHYIDAHIIKDNKLIGVFALEEIIRLKKTRTVDRSLFVNNCNTSNFEMELQLQEVIKKEFGILKFKYRCSEYNPNRKTTDKNVYMKDANKPLGTFKGYKSSQDLVKLINWDLILQSKTEL